MATHLPFPRGVKADDPDALLLHALIQNLDTEIEERDTLQCLAPLITPEIAVAFSRQRSAYMLDIGPRFGLEPEYQLAAMWVEGILLGARLARVRVQDGQQS